MSRSLPILLLLILPSVAWASQPLEPYATYQGRFYQRLGARCIQDHGPQPPCVALLEKSLRYDPNAPLVHYTLGRYHLAVEAGRKALGAFSRAIELDETFTAARVGQGDAYSLLEDYPAAREAYHRALSQTPTETEAAYGIAATWAAEMQERKALAALEQALALGFEDMARIKGDPRWRNVWGSPTLDALLDSKSRLKNAP